MTDAKTEQALTDALRLAAKSAAPYGTAMIGASHLTEAADTIDTLRAQLAEAQRYAERYRSLRRGQKWSVIDWKGDALRADDLDASIDAAKGESNA